MKKNRTIFFLSLMYFSSKVQAQTTYSDVASIFYTHCTSCHHDGGIAPMPLMNYTETSPWATSIVASLQGSNGKLMPPFHADTAYSASGHSPQKFLNDRSITAAEKNAILDWINDGALPANASLPTPPAYGDLSNKLNGVADMEVGIGQFTSNATTSLVAPNNCFTVTGSLTQDMWLRAFEVLPGNSAIVHHVTVNVDSTGNVVSDISGNCNTPGGQIVIGSWLPGADPTIFPSDPSFRLGIRIPAGSNFIFNVHYLPGSGGQLDDNTRIRLFFYPIGTTGIRPIHTDAMLQQWDYLGNLPGSAGSIPPNMVKTFTGVSANPAQIPHAPQPSTAMTLLATAGHSHKLCTKIKIYASKTGDTIPVLRINDWNPDWQGFFTYTKPVMIPAGYILKSEHVYDNRTSNPHVSGTPVKTNFGANPYTSEMLSDSFQWLDYQTGDENMDMKALVANDPLLRVGIDNTEAATLQTYIYPNPASDMVNIYLSKKSLYKARIFNISGQSILATDTFYDRLTLDSKNIPAGLYILEILDTVSNEKTSKKIIISK